MKIDQSDLNFGTNDDLDLSRNDFVDLYKYSKNNLSLRFDFLQVFSLVFKS